MAIKARSALIAFSGACLRNGEKKHSGTSISYVLMDAFQKTARKKTFSKDYVGGGRRFWSNLWIGVILKPLISPPEGEEIRATHLTNLKPKGRGSGLELS